MKAASVIFCVLAVSDVFGAQAFARGGGGSNLMSSPGYQRRLQESRRQATNQPAMPPYTTPPSTYPGSTWRSRGKR